MSQLIRERNLAEKELRIWGLVEEEITNVDCIPDGSLVSTEHELSPSAPLTEALSSPR